MISTDLKYTRAKNWHLKKHLIVGSNLVANDSIYPLKCIPEK
jgi:hypothetical protein